MNYLDIDTKYTPKKLVKLGYEKSFTEKIRNGIKKNEFKRKVPEVLKIPFGENKVIYDKAVFCLVFKKVWECGGLRARLTRLRRLNNNNLSRVGGINPEGIHPEGLPAPQKYPFHGSLC